VHLPRGYEKATTRYPVLYHLYGQQVTHDVADAVTTTERLAGAAFGLDALTAKPGLFQASIPRIENPFPGEKAFRQFFLDNAAGFVKETPRLKAFVRLNVESSVEAPTLESRKRSRRSWAPSSTRRNSRSRLRSSGGWRRWRKRCRSRSSFLACEVLGHGNRR
jgi:hypothetical protein